MKPLTREWIAKAEGDYRTACRESRVRRHPKIGKALRAEVRTVLHIE